VSVVTLEPCAIGDRRIVLGTASESGTTRVRSGACAAGILAFGVWVLAAAAAHASPGTLTSAAELAVVRAAADAGSSPAKEDRDRLLADARKTWAWGSVSGAYGTIDNAGSKQCSPMNGVGVSYLLEGAPDAYAQVIGAHLSGDTSLASQARAHVLDLIDTTGFTGLSGDYNANNQCILDLSLAIPVWIETARLLEDTSIWKSADTAAFRGWLASQVYPKTAWASRVRRNNWGAAGSLASDAIASYVAGGIASLEEYSPTRLTLAPAQAVAQHVAMQLSRVASTWVGDAQCAKHGIQWHGGIPEELRRGSTGCDGTYLLASDAARTYQMMHTELLVFHAEAMRRRGDLSLYQAKTSQGAPAILQAILFVVRNPSPGGVSWPWEPARWGTLITAASFYPDATLASLVNSSSATFRGGRTLPYTRITARPVATTSPTPSAELGAPGPPYLMP
jgi:hypothetical protein